MMKTTQDNSSKAPQAMGLTLMVLNEREFLSVSSALCMVLPVAPHSFVIPTASFSWEYLLGHSYNGTREPLIPFEFFIPESQATESHVSFH